MKSFKQYLQERLKAGQEAKPEPKTIHAYYDDTEKEAKPRHSGSSSGGNGSEELEEGNPLSRIAKFGQEKRHFVAITSERSSKSKKENEKNLKELKGKLKAQGYGYRRAQGQWEGGKEKSLIVHAKEPGAESGRELVRDMLQHGRHYDQDSIFHNNGDAGHLIGTNETGYPGNKKVVRKGITSYNKEKTDFQTEFRPGKRKSPARITTKGK